MQVIWNGTRKAPYLSATPEVYRPAPALIVTPRAPWAAQRRRAGSIDAQVQMLITDWTPARAVLDAMPGVSWNQINQSLARGLKLGWAERRSVRKQRVFGAAHPVWEWRQR